MKATHEFTAKLSKRAGPVGAWYAKLPFTAYFGFSPNEIATPELRVLFHELIDDLSLEVMTRYRDAYAPEP